MAQAFCDRIKYKGGVRTWLLVIADLSLSIPQQIVEVTLMSQKWMVLIAVAGSVLVVSASVLDLGGPASIAVLGGGLFFVILGALSLWSARRNGVSTEYTYKGGAPKAWTWWTLLAAGLAVLYVLAATGQLIATPKGTNVGALAIMAGFASLIFIGLKLRQGSRVLGNWMIVFATVPALTFFWVIWPAVLGLAIIVGSVKEAFNATPQAPLPA
jgi:hypothetical protein